MIIPLILLETTPEATTTDLISLMLTLFPVIIMMGVVVYVAHSMTSFGSSSDHSPNKHLLETRSSFERRQKITEFEERLRLEQSQRQTTDEEEEEEPEPEAPIPEPVYHSKYGIRVDKAADMLKQQYAEQMANENKPWYKRKKVKNNG